MALDGIQQLPKFLTTHRRTAAGAALTPNAASAAEAMLDLSTRGRTQPGGASRVPRSREEALAAADHLAELIAAGIIGWEWHKDTHGVAHRVFAEAAVFGFEKDEKPLKPGETP